MTSWAENCLVVAAKHDEKGESAKRWDAKQRLSREKCQHVEFYVKTIRWVIWVIYRLGSRVRIRNLKNVSLTSGSARQFWRALPSTSTSKKKLALLSSVACIELFGSFSSCWEVALAESPFFISSRFVFSWRLCFCPRPLRSRQSLFLEHLRRDIKNILSKWANLFLRKILLMIFMLSWISRARLCLPFPCLHFSGCAWWEFRCGSQCCYHYPLLLKWERHC